MIAKTMAITYVIEDKRIAKRCDIFIIHDEPYILATTEHSPHKMGLVALNDGNLFEETQPVKDFNAVTADELKSLAGGIYLTKAIMRLK